MKEGWTHKSFGDITTFSRGLTFAKDDVAEISSKKVLRSNNIDLNSHSLVFDDVACLKEDFVIPEEKKLHKGDIFICMSNGSTQHLGKVAYIEDDMDYAFGGFMGAIHPNQNETYPKFVYYACLSSDYFRFLASVSNGININNLKWSDLSEFSIPVPSIEIQTNIASELDLLQSIIDKQQAQLKELDNLAQAVFYDMFDDPAENEKWGALKTIGETCVLKSGDSSANNSDIGSLPYVKVGDMNIKENNPYITTSSSFVDRNSNLKHIFPVGSILFPKRGGAIFTNKKRLTAVEICCDLNIMGVIPKEELLSVYLYHYFLSIDFSELCNGAAIPQLNNNDIAPLRISIPPLPLQQSFAEKIESIEKQKAFIGQSIAETQRLFDYTMNKYFG